MRLTRTVAPALLALALTAGCAQGEDAEDLVFTFPDEFRGAALDRELSDEQALRSSGAPSATYDVSPSQSYTFTWMQGIGIDRYEVEPSMVEGEVTSVGEGLCFQMVGPSDAPTCVVEVHGGSMVLVALGIDELTSSEDVMDALEEMAAEVE